jgi:hypothetical protein
MRNGLKRQFFVFSFFHIYTLGRPQRFGRHKNCSKHIDFGGSLHLMYSPAMRTMD